jgi:hypothetical protein
MTILIPFSRRQADRRVRLLPSSTGLITLADFRGLRGRPAAQAAVIDARVRLAELSGSDCCISDVVGIDIEDEVVTHSVLTVPTWVITLYVNMPKRALDSILRAGKRAASAATRRSAMRLARELFAPTLLLWMG